MLRRLKDSFSCFDGQNGHRGSAEESGFGLAAAIINSVSGAIESDRAQAAQERDFCRSGGASKMHSFGAKCSTSYVSSDDNGDESEASLDSDSGDEELSNNESPTFVCTIFCLSGCICFMGHLFFVTLDRELIV